VPGTPEQATLTVVTTPVNGPVFVNESSWGTAPKTQAVSPGTYTVRFGAVTGYNLTNISVYNNKTGTGQGYSGYYSVTVTLAANDDITVIGVYTLQPVPTPDFSVSVSPNTYDYWPMFPFGYYYTIDFYVSVTGFNGFNQSVTITPVNGSGTYCFANPGYFGFAIPPFDIAPGQSLPVAVYPLSTLPIDVELECTSGSLVHHLIIHFDHVTSDFSSVVYSYQFY